MGATGGCAQKSLTTGDTEGHGGCVDDADVFSVGRELV